MDLELLGADAPPGCVVETHRDGTILTWGVANESAQPVAISRVLLRGRTTGGTPERMLRNGWQSWSASGGGPIDPGTDARSDLVTVLAGDGGAMCLGFEGGASHDGVFRVRGSDVIAEASLGDAVLAPGERRDLHRVRIEPGDPAVLLERWAKWAGERSAARPDAPYRAGWCSWYQYFHGVTEAALRANLARAPDWPIELFQLDDGYQAAIGEWLTCSDAFPSPLARLASDIASAGLIPGIWLAPFLVSPRSRTAAERPAWILRAPSGDPVVGANDEAWGGEQFVLDTTHPDAQAHLEALARRLVEMGWRYLKLDFTFAAALSGRAHDASRSPAERVRLGFDALRRGAGEDAFILGCGAPLGPCIGVADGMRIGPDVAPFWTPRPSVLGGSDDAPATRNAWRNTLARSFMHRRLWLNDPDCLLLRESDTDLTEEQRRAWAYAVAGSGGMVLISDELALLDRAARTLLDEVLAIGRVVDEASRSGTAPVCPDLLEHWTPAMLESGAWLLTGDPDRGTATIETPGRDRRGEMADERQG
ncbi:MAG: glycoside hydrolase family 36 protein [Actinomycetota bacterium]